MDIQTNMPKSNPNVDLEIRKLVYAQIDKFVSTYNYASLHKQLSDKVNYWFKEQVLLYNKNAYTKRKLISLHGGVVSKSFERIVIGDYGAYYEISKEDINENGLFVPDPQKYRLLPSFKGKYQWYSLIADPSVKIYFQLSTVKYADYKPKMYYISVFDVI